MKMITLKIIMNYFVKLILTSIVIFSFLVSLLIVNNIGFLSLGRLAKGINQESISSIKLGMNKCQIIDILGAPLDSSKTYITLSNGKIRPESINVSYLYSKPEILWDIEIYIGFKDNKVIYISMEESDQTFYIYDKNNLARRIDFNIYNRVIPKLKALEY